MRATIEVGRNPTGFWLAAREMCVEHLGYYARENGFRANLRMFQAMVDAYNAGNPQALHYGAMAAVGGLRPEVKQAIADLDGEIADSAQEWGAFDSVHTHGDPGFSFQVNPDLDGKVYAAWETSAGNVLSVCLDGEWVTITVEGRRHGIPWRFIAPLLPSENWVVLGMKSQSREKPWMTGAGESLLPSKQDFVCSADSSPLEEYPSWGDYNQQAGWAADRVFCWSQIGGICNFAAAQSLPSSAVRRLEKGYLSRKANGKLEASPTWDRRGTWVIQTQSQGVRLFI